MDLRQIEYVGAVARTMNFTRAAVELHVAQPALSAAIRRLETELGVQLFRRTSRRGHVLPSQLSGDSIASIVKQRVRAIGLDPTRYSGHSLRAGFVTSAATAGAPAWKISAQTGHVSDALVGRYIRLSDPFAATAVPSIRVL